MLVEVVMRPTVSATTVDTNGFGALGAYLVRGKGATRTANRAVYTLSGNVSSPEAAAEEMAATAARNLRCRDPVKHIVLSWEHWERPSHDQVADCVRSQLEALGYETHQWLAVAHQDTSNFHVHLMVNRVDPLTYFVHKPHPEFLILDRECRELELRHGWTRTNGYFTVVQRGDGVEILGRRERAALEGAERRISHGARSAERWSGQVSFQTHLLETGLGERVRQLLETAKSWGDVVAGLAPLGLRLERHGGGGVLVAEDEEGRAATAKLSLLDDGDRRFGLPHLEQSLGPFGDPGSIQAQAHYALAKLSGQAAVFTERDIDAWLSVHAERRERDDIKRAIVEHGCCVHLKADDKGAARFALEGVLDLERRAMGFVEALTGPAGTMNPRAVQRAIDGRTMREDQLAAFHHCLAHRIACVVGKPGVGKSYMMAALRESYEGSGHTVYGVGPSNAVRDDMARGGYQNAFTVDKLLLLIGTGDVRLQPGDCLLLDEAGMVETPKLCALLHQAQVAGCEIKLVGDPMQLPAVGLGGMFQAILDRLGSATVHVITRQKDARQREAAQHAADFRFKEALAIFHEEGLIDYALTEAEARYALLDRYEREYRAEPGRERFIIAFRNADVDAFNEQVHHLRVREGHVTDCRAYPTVRGDLELGVGDRIAVTGSMRVPLVAGKPPPGSQGKDPDIMRVTNGMRGIVRGTEADQVLVEFPDHKVSVLIPMTEKTELRAAYAGTVHKAQGATIDSTYLFYTRDWKDAAANVALSRQTKATRLFVARETAYDWREMAEQMSRTMVKAAAISVSEAEQRHAVTPVRDISTPLVRALSGDAPVVDRAPDQPRNKRISPLTERYRAEVEAPHAAAMAAWTEAVATLQAERNQRIATLEATHAALMAQIIQNGADRVEMAAERTRFRAELTAASATYRERLKVLVRPRLVPYHQWAAGERARRKEAVSAPPCPVAPEIAKPVATVPPPPAVKPEPAAPAALEPTAHPQAPEPPPAADASLAANELSVEDYLGRLEELAVRLRAERAGIETKLATAPAPLRPFDIPRMMATDRVEAQWLTPRVETERKAVGAAEAKVARAEKAVNAARAALDGAKRTSLLPGALSSAVRAARKELEAAEANLTRARSEQVSAEKALSAAKDKLRSGADYQREHAAAQEMIEAEDKRVKNLNADKHDLGRRIALIENHLSEIEAPPLPPGTTLFLPPDLGSMFGAALADHLAADRRDLAAVAAGDRTPRAAERAPTRSADEVVLAEKGVREGRKVSEAG